MVVRAKELCQREAPELEDHEDQDFVTGYYVFKNYRQRRADVNEAYSDPILVEGVCYRLNFVPKGWGDGTNTHISVGLRRNKAAFLNQDVDDLVSYNYTMLHSSNHTKDFKTK